MGERALWPGLDGTPLDLPLSDGLGGAGFVGGIAQLYEKCKHAGHENKPLPALRSLGPGTQVSGKRCYVTRLTAPARSQRETACALTKTRA
jgi:hypothetical protein